MKSSISTKLFVAVLASVLSVILIMGLTANWSFARGFLGYLNEQAMQRRLLSGISAAVPAKPEA